MHRIKKPLRMTAGDRVDELERTVRRQRRLLRTIAAGAVVLLAFLSLETLSRLFLPHLDSPLKKAFLVDTKRDRTPYTMFGRPPYHGPKPARGKPPGEYRVFMLGGSTTEQGNPPIAEHLENELRSHGLPSARVYNWGVVSSQTSQELARIVFDIADLSPDLILMYDGANDIVNPFLSDPRPGYPFDFIVWEHNPLLSDDVRNYPLFSLFAYGTYLGRFCCSDWFAEQFTDLDGVRRSVGYRTQEWQEELVRIFVANLVKARKISAAFGADFIGFYQPTVWYKKPRTDAEEEMAAGGDFEEAMQHALVCVRQGFAAVKRDGLAGEHDLVDLTDAFDGIKESVYWNAVHINDEFRVVVARRIRQAVFEMLDAKGGEAPTERVSGAEASPPQIPAQ